MPATKRRIRPVIEEIVETEPARESSHKSESAHKRHVRVEEEAAPLPIVHEVAQYDEPAMEAAPMEENHIHHHTHESHEAEEAAREFLSSDSPSGEKKANLKLVFVVTIVTALIVGFIAGGVYVYVSGVSNVGEVTETPTPSFTPEPSSEPTTAPTSTPQVNVSGLSVNVLNGSGVIGAAGKVKSALESAGFKVGGTGNAANYNFKDTVVQVKAGTPTGVVDLLKKALKEYVVEVGDELPSSSKYDVVVTAGKS